MTDFFLLLKLAGAGDQLQGIKRGIIEMADAILINKSDGENQNAAQSAKVEFQKALHLYPLKESGWIPKVKCISAINNTGILKTWEMIENFINNTKNNNYFDKNRFTQQKFWLFDSLNQKLKQNFYQHPQLKVELKHQLEAIEQQKTSSFRAADLLYEYYLKCLKEE